MNLIQTCFELLFSFFFCWQVGHTSCSYSYPTSCTSSTLSSGTCGVECNSNYDSDCYGQSLTCRSASSSSTAFSCNGYYSCYEASTLSSYIGGAINCHGSFSCFQSGTLYHSYYQTSMMYYYTSYSYTYCSTYTNTCIYEINIDCSGLFSCASLTKGIECYDTAVECKGELSCQSTNITHKYLSSTYLNSHADGDSSIGAKLECLGSQSCANTIAELENGLTGNYNFYGHLSAWNGLFISFGTSYFYFYGPESGLNSKIFCKSSQTCNIYCHSNACNGLQVVCSSCTKVNVNCMSAQKSDLCPSGFDLDLYNWGNLLPTLSNYTMSTYANSYSPCNQATARSDVLCDDYEECMESTDGILSVSGTKGYAICCVASESCADSDSITNYNTKNTNGVAIRCDGYKSCENIKGTMLSSNGAGNIYLSGAYSAYAMDATNSSIDASYSNNIFCTGSSSCQYQTMRNGDKLLCLGYASCWNSILIENFNKIFGYAYVALYLATIRNIDDSVYCGTTCACQEADIKGVGKNVVGMGENALYQATVSDVNGNLVVFGDSGLYQATIQNVSNIICDGTQCLNYATIEGVESLVVSGTNSLSNAEIASFESVRSKYFIARINGTNSKKFDITCKSNVICNIFCESSNACSNLYLFCNQANATCYIDCNDENGIDCPSVYGSYYFWSSNEPTFNPTQSPISPTAPTMPTIPTTKPTDVPSINPTDKPTDRPSDINIKNPSSIPTENPTNAPSIGINTFKTTNKNVGHNHSNSNGNSSNNTMGILVGIGIGAGVCVIIGIIICICKVWKRKKLKQIVEAMEGLPEGVANEGIDVSVAHGPSASIGSTNSPQTNVTVGAAFGTAGTGISTGTTMHTGLGTAGVLSETKGKGKSKSKAGFMNKKSKGGFMKLQQDSENV